VQGTVGVAVTAQAEPVTVVFPDDAGMGATPTRAANWGSLLGALATCAVVGRSGAVLLKGASRWTSEGEYRLGMAGLLRYGMVAQEPADWKSRVKVRPIAIISGASRATSIRLMGPTTVSVAAARFPIMIGTETAP
jgi:hypothetical protein